MRRDLWATLENYQWHEATLVTLCGAENVSALNAQQQVQEQTGGGTAPGAGAQRALGDFSFHLLRWCVVLQA